ncbi:MAG: response regulator [Deltaproteobacteria bacterium]|nr:response regulator [Deltaproteobacteria bacterium]
MIFFKKFEKPEDEPVAPESDLTQLRASIKKQLPENIAWIAIKELDRLEKTDPSVPEYGIGLSYIEFLISLPWTQTTDDNLDIKRAEEIFTSQHYGLAHVKDRILEFLAVRILFNIRSFHVLVVDDEDIARTNLEYILKKEGYIVSTAVNGADALEKVMAGEFDLILTDLKMEKMDGMQLVESVKRVSPHTDIVMITGFATVSSAVDALKKGAAHYLPKPINLDELRTTVRQILEKKKHKLMTRSPILCFAGPPGTGKTSIGKAIAEALERKFIRLSMAGFRDEAELRGHRRTYVGAMAGRIINEIKRVGVKNPVFMLDELDKIGQDFRGDPASVLLEILDPEQNTQFMDHYVDIPFDLSSVMFIATANMVEKIPAPLLDRLEIIHFTGYTENEKRVIAKNHIIPGQLRNHGLSHDRLVFSDTAITRIIRDYTQEAGLRNLEREFANVCRKLARICLDNPDNTCVVNVEDSLVEQLLGPRKYMHEIAETENQVGVTTGLVWSELGGEIIFVEATKMKGSQQLILTGSLGNVLQESAQTALSFLRSHGDYFGIQPDFFKDTDIHIHFPCSAIPKDGPSAGITIALALISLLTQRPARRDVAMTGELTLNGRILPISGVREKILAAQRAGIKVVIFPKRNTVDVNNLEPESCEGLEVVLTDDIKSIVDRVIDKGECFN